jgi:hypothetical protein
MVTGIGFCGRIGRRKRERQIRLLCDHPERFQFYALPPKKNRKLVIIDKNGEKIIKRL